MKKNVLYVDLENGKDSMLTRLEQSLTGLTKLEVIEGANDKKIQRKIRKYLRLGSEIVVERLPALTTDADTIQRLMDMYYRVYGLRFDILIVDYLGKMGSLSKKTDDFGRISDAYMDVANLCDKNKIDHCWTACGYEGKSVSRMILVHRAHVKNRSKCVLRSSRYRVHIRMIINMFKRERGSEKRWVKRVPKEAASISCSLGMRVEPPTNTISWMSEFFILASFITCLL